MINRSFKAMVLGVLFCSSLVTPVQAASVTQHTAVIGISGAVSGLCLAKAFNKLRDLGFSREISALVILLAVPTAGYIRRSLVPVATDFDDAVGLLAAIGSFAATV